MEWIHLAQKREQWWGLVNTGKYKSRLATFNFSGITLLFGLNWHTTYIWHLEDSSHCEFF